MGEGRALYQKKINYSPKWRWLAVDIYRAAKRRGKYPTLATDTEVHVVFFEDLLLSVSGEERLNVARSQ